MAFVAALACIGSAQGYRRPDAFNTTMEGRGSVRINGQTYSFNQLQVTLQSNERVTVHALLYSANNRDVVMSGRLKDRSSRGGRLVADINSVEYGRDHDTADATATIDLSSGERFSAVTVRGRNTSDRNSVSLDFTGNGRQVTQYQGDRDRDRNRDRDDRSDRDHDWNRDRDWNRDWDRDDNRRAHGLYTDADEWRRRGEHFLVRYNLDLDRNGRAKMTVKAEDRNMPNDRNSQFAHGAILEYLERGRDVVQTGRWSQNGNNITIIFDRIETGNNNNRSRREVLKGKIRNGTIWMDQYDQNLYGHRVNLTFEKRNIFR
jgi:hypothetical protein